MRRSGWALALLLAFPALPAAPQTREPTPLKRAETVLEQGANDGDPDVRREVAVALGLAARRETPVRLLGKLAADKDHLVRESALVSIGELHDPQLAAAARKALDDDVPEVAFAAARALFKMRDAEGKQLLIQIVDREASAKSNFVRAKLRDVIRKIKRPKSAMLFAVQEGVGFIPLPGVGEGFSALSSLVGDPDFSARATALLVLAPDRSAAVRRVIEQAFNDSDWSMRAAATQIAASRNERAWRSRLVPLFDDGNRRVRYRAAAAYLRLSSPLAAVPQKPAEK
jgi:HEAT repeat protein